MDVRLARFAFLALCGAYFLGVLFASQSPGPVSWGLHSLGFLKTGTRAVLIGTGICAGVLALWGCFFSPSSPGTTRFHARYNLGPFGIVALILGLCATLYALRCRTHFLGDGIVWLTILKTGQHQVYSEPLAAAIWSSFASMVRAVEPSASAASFGLLSILCGGVFFLICRALVPLLGAEEEVRADAVFLLSTLGITELFCGYLESYPPVMVLIFAYLWLGLRDLARKAAFAAVPILLSLATASHFLSFYLWPSYLYIVGRRESRPSRRVLWCLLPLMLTLGLALATGSRPNDWVQSGRIVLRVATLPTAIPWTLDQAFDLGHVADLGSEVLLVMPIALLLGIAGVAVRDVRDWLRSPAATFLTMAALSGSVTAFMLVLPAPALDWDLFALLIAPLAVLFVGLGIRLLQAKPSVPFRLGVAGLSLSAILPFLFVNADEEASIHRIKTLIGPGTMIPVAGRAYPNGMLAEFYEDRRDFQSALTYAKRAYECEPTNPRYSVKLGSEYFHLGEYLKAARSYDEAIRRGWDRAATRHDLGLCYAMSGRALEALRELRTAVRMPGGSRPDYLHDLGVGYARAGYADSARVVWTRVLERWPGYAPTVRSLVSRYGRRSPSASPDPHLPTPRGGTAR